ncbi:MAG TPA: 2-C-methyl-D-erythritol 2,4-cyclodiphosphate synthase [Acidimicrobiia bacterium]|nr:2-C-methyl-D-erythritol 2,4-cyclodiphosphate synthase [Acidimicrobiia bacterium]
MRVAFGFDAHRLGGSPPLILGGVVVDPSVGVEAWSDGDVVGHAVIDAVLGVAGLGDIGAVFPSGDERWKGADSMAMLAEAVAKAGERGFQVAFADVTVVAEAVRVAPHREQIRTRLAAVLGVDEGRVSVKATTTDGLGFIGRGEGVAAVAVVTAVRSGP